MVCAMSSRILEAACDLARRGKRGAMVTIVETTGSTPRKAGAKMLVDEDGRVTGTVGGGCVEADLYGFAREVIRTGRVQVREVDLSARTADENDMLCGGRIRVVIEPVMADEQVVILGAGHISRALCEICRLLDFQVTVTDDREAFCNAGRFPGAQRLVVAPFEEQFAGLEIGPSASVVIVTRGHQYDEVCMEQALRSGAGYIALVGSRTKVGVFRAHLREKGFTKEQLDRVECPAGLDIGAETPEEIAISIAARLVQVRRGARRAAADS